MDSREAQEHLPLTPAVFHILLAVADRQLHGLGIADEAERASGGIHELGPGTLYRSLAELAERGWVERVPAPEGADPRRKYYGSTEEGRRVLAAEVVRLQRLVAEARDREVVPEGA